MDEARPVPRAADDRAEAFARFTQARLATFYRLATAILGDRVEAEDATHDAAVRAWQRWGSLRDAGNFDQWFQRILVNECRDRLRRRRSRPSVTTLAPDAEADRVGDPLSGFEERVALREALDRLTPDHRIVIVLRFYLELDTNEISRLTGLRPGTVKSRLHYALEALRAASDAVARAEGGSR